MRRKANQIVELKAVKQRDLNPHFPFEKVDSSSAREKIGERPGRCARLPAEAAFIGRDHKYAVAEQAIHRG
jgi:hypothetical protein